MVASAVAPVAASASALASLFTGAPAAATEPAPGALAYAATAAAPQVESVEVPLPPRRPAALAGGATLQFASLSTDVPATPAVAEAAVPAVEVPLPPRRPNGLGAPVQVAEATPAALSELRLSSGTLPPAAAPAPVEVAQAAADAVEVPLPPRRPAAKLLAMAAAPRPAVAAPVQEAIALPPQ